MTNALAKSRTALDVAWAFKGQGCRWMTLASAVLVAAFSGGCAHVEPPIPPALMAQRILAPAGVGERDLSLREQGQDFLPPRSSSATKASAANGEPEMLGVPRKADDGADDRRSRDGPKPLTLEEAISMAFQFQPRLRVYEERIREAQGQGQVAFAPFLPQVGLLTQAFFAQNPSDPQRFPIPAPEFGDAPGYSNYQIAELQMQWTLWDFGRTYGRYQQAGLGIDIARLQALRASQTVAFEVASAYYAVLEARAALRVAREAVRLAESVLDISQKSLRAGFFERDQVLRAEVQLAQARRSVVNATREEQVAVAALNLAIGINVSTPTDIVDRTDEPPFDLPLADCLARAIDNRWEFQVAQRSVSAAAEGQRVARADFAPRVYFQGVAAAEEGAKVRHGTTETATISMAWSLYQGGQRQGQLNSASAALRAAAAQAQVVCDTIAYEVNVAYRDVDAARRNIELARPAVTQARENLRLVTRKYEAGDATPTDVVDAETSLTRAERDLYTAQYDYLTALARIAYAMGLAPVLSADRSN
jgi:outer membrane protein TolC